jgi:hypothetical protein
MRKVTLCTSESYTLPTVRLLTNLIEFFVNLIEIYKSTVDVLDSRIVGTNGFFFVYIQDSWFGQILVVSS